LPGRASQASRGSPGQAPGTLLDQPLTPFAGSRSGYEPDEVTSLLHPALLGWPVERLGGPRLSPGLRAAGGIAGAMPGLGRTWRRPTLPRLSDAVPSALRVFTAEFGMGSGGSPLAMATRFSEAVIRGQISEPMRRLRPRPLILPFSDEASCVCVFARGVCRPSDI
jgi:hypothetical protein